MSLLEKASFICTPNAYKTSKLYSVVPNTTLGDIDVVRATTATRINASGLIESVGVNIPRIDYTNGSCPSLLVEPQRTNLITYSEQFSNANWAKSSISVSENTAISPDGTTNADKIYPSVSGTAFTYQLASPTSSISKSFSIYVKAAGKNYCWILNSSGSIGCRFDLINGTVVNTPSGNVGTIKNVGNGWYRITNTYTSLDSYGGIGPCDSESTDAVTVNGTDGLFVYGAQLEQGSYATSYIPTVASSVTRNADVISKTGISSLIGQTEGTLFTEIKLESVNSQSVYTAITSGGFANSILIGKESGVIPNKLLLFINAGGTNILNNTSISLTSNYIKCAIAYKSGDWAAYVNGALIASGNSTFSFSSSFDRFGFGNNGSLTTSNEKIEVKSSQLYKTRLSNTELAQLTTI